MSSPDTRQQNLPSGYMIGGRYRVTKCLGAGSMGLVYLCEHKELPGHFVAVKVLFSEVVKDPVASARFRNEVFASYGVSHPNVVRAYDYLTDGELVAYTMEYVGGGALVDLIHEKQPLSIEKVVKYLIQMCAGVQAIHDAGIVHRDLKPENILLTPEDTIKITDFGIARTDTGPRLTEHGGVLGTIDYVSPEYMIDSKVDWRSDLYAIGVMAYEMITGDLPFRGESVYATMTKRLKSDPPPPSTYISACPPALDAIVLRAMRRDPTSRYQSAAEIFYDLEPLSTGTTLPSGAFMQISRRASSSYQGPILEETRKKNGVRVLEFDESKDPADTAVLEEVHGNSPSAASEVDSEATSGIVDKFLASSWADGLIIVAVILLALGISFVLFEKVSP